MWKKALIGVFICLSFLFVSMSTLYAASRVALVIGNAGYQSAPLRNPVNDARDMAKVLRGLNFGVIERLNADKKEMVRAIDEFYKRLKRADMGLFYFAGHGMQIQGLNYLIPVKAHVQSETDVEFEAVHAGRVLGKMDEAGNKLNIVILDACRDNPFKRSFRTERKGLAQMDAPIGTIVAYSTSPGSVAADGRGRNGIYTKHLLKHIARQDLSVSDVFREAGLGVMEETKAKQVPWTSSTPVRRYYLASSGWGDDQPGRRTSLSIRCNVDSALVMVDGTPVGHTPLKGHPLSPGQHRIVVQKSGHEPYRDTVEVGKGRSLTLRVMLEPVGPRKARLYVDTNPSDASIRILNIGPRFSQGMELDPGRYHVEVTADRHEGWKEWVTLAAGEDRNLMVRLDPISVSAGGVGGEQVETFTVKGASFKMIRIPAGEFMMGSPSNESGRDSDEGPRHRVRITKSFWMGETEVTQGLWQAVMGSNPSYFSSCGANCPVEKVSWNDCQQFIRKLNTKVSGGGFRLPTEAEWEYACRAGTAGPYAGDLDAMGWYSKNSGDKTHRVAQKEPNAWGLYDMHGNVWEWCQDWYGDYPSGTVTDPTGPSGGFLRVDRGGGWDDSAWCCRSADRDRNTPGYRNGNLGFRLARN